jgi:putative FmdB family regulatory protein
MPVSRAQEAMMPIYEYQCEGCGHCFERLTFAGDEDGRLRCPVCKGQKVRKQVSCASRLSGGGRGLCSDNASSRFS